MMNSNVLHLCVYKNPQAKMHVTRQPEDQNVLDFVKIMALL